MHTGKALKHLMKHQRFTVSEADVKAISEKTKHHSLIYFAAGMGLALKARSEVRVTKRESERERGRGKEAGRERKEGKDVRGEESRENVANALIPRCNKPYRFDLPRSTREQSVTVKRM